MSLKELSLKKFYTSDIDDLLNTFYVPSLSQSKEYLRLTGYFTSKSLEVASQGVLKLIENGGNIKLICSPFFTKEDIETIRQFNNFSYILEKNLTRNIDECYDKISIFGYLLKNQKIEIKIAVVFNDDNFPCKGEEVEKIGLFHQKVGVLKDELGNYISFSGSNNETVSGWTLNNEEFKVFRSWIVEENEYVKSDIQKFLRYWKGVGKNLQVFSLPEAVKQKILKIYTSTTQNQNSEFKKKQIILFDYQKQAILNWSKNNHKGIFEMATGTGKTYTALGCLAFLEKEIGKFVTLISCPFNHLIIQWKKEIIKFGIKDKIIICDSSNKTWAKDLYEKLADYFIYKNFSFIILSTHSTLSSDKFTNLVSKFKEVNFLFIADEMHGLGASISKKGLLDLYRFRLGLSATPQRWFDLEGTDYLYKYFDKVVYEFTLKDAVCKLNPITGTTFLTPYYFKAKFCSLEIEELEYYQEVTQKIIRNSIQKETSAEACEINKLLLFRRANITKTANSKYSKLIEILNEIYYRQKNFKGTIIYCSSIQLDNVMDILFNLGICYSKITMKEGTKVESKFNNMSEREFILKEFESGNYEVLIGIKCLDEGINVPQAKNAILLSNSGNPRERIQRIGRVLRRSNGKIDAYIYDIIIAPSKHLNQDLYVIEKRIFNNELVRLREIASNAINNVESIKEINNIKEDLI